MTENKLEITKTSKNGKDYQNIDLNKLNSGESVVVKKINDVVKRTPRKGNQWNPEKEWTMCQSTVEYKGQQVGFFIPGGYGFEKVGDELKAKFVENTVNSDKFDAVGKAGDQVRISVEEALAKNNKDKKIATRNYTFTKVN